MSEQKTYTFHVSGMHCAACTILIEDNLKEAAGVDEVKAHLAQNKVVVRGIFEDAPNVLADKLTKLIEKHGYVLSVEAKKKDRNWSDFKYALPIAAALILGFSLLQKAGLVNLISSSEVGYGTALLIGLVASVSTCLAVVGGLVLSLSANYAKQGASWKPQVMFHFGRLAGFFILGGLLGALGSSLTLNATCSLILGGLVALIMLALGLNLLDIFHFTKRLQIALPKSFTRLTLRERSTTGILAPLLIGAITFFLPCGFTQAMQFYALSTGSFMRGGLTMLVFALGTLPVLALLSFGSVNINRKSWRGIFFKTAGLIVIALGVFNLLNTLVAAGIINPVFNF